MARELVWDDRYTVGVKRLDDQHRSIIFLINEVSTLFGKTSDEVEINQILQKVKEYANDHFLSEEQLLEKYKYYGLDDHKKEHRMYEDTIRNFEQNIRNVNVDTRVELLEFLADWWMGHIQGSDMEYRRFLNNNGVF